MVKKIRPTVLIILDGFGIGQPSHTNPVHAAKKPNVDKWFTEYPHAALGASGQAVGLPAGVMGNSEVGHLTIGSGRVIKQPLTIINEAINDGSFLTHPTLIDQLALLKKNKKKLHLIGLLSDAGVHSHEQHLYALLEVAAQQKLTDVFIHAFLDGRDSAPTSAPIYLQRLDAQMQRLGVGTIGTLQGRYYAMDRDGHWQRTRESYDVMTQPRAAQFSQWQPALEYWYAQGITDEFIPPTSLRESAVIEDGDGVICFNVREERIHQLTAAFLSQHFNHFPRKKIDLSSFVILSARGDYFLDCTQEERGCLNLAILYPQPVIEHTLLDTLSAAGKKTFVIAETEKYAHVTYFFNGGCEEPVAAEQQVLVKSLGAKQYIEHPEMSAPEITQTVLESLERNPCDFYVINYANADMVAHSGNFDATVKAIECLDQELGKLYAQVVEKMDGTMYITADHGNAEKNFDGLWPVTAHTTNPVPFLAISKEWKNVRDQKLPLQQLSDIAVFILKQMKIHAS